MTEPTIEVVLAVYQPDLAALERQMASVVGQQGCVARVHLFADGPMPQIEEIGRIAAAQPNVQLTCFPENRGPAITFLEGLAHVLTQSCDPAARWFAFCDQDDVWHPGKLAASLDLLQSAGVACIHGDARVVDDGLQVIHPSLFALEQRETQPSITSLFFRNNATGMTMLFDEALAADAVRLAPLRPRRWLHDHFIAFLAACGRGMAWHPSQMTDYVQHSGNVVGAGRTSFRWPSGGFLNSRGDAAVLARQAGALVRALLEGGDLAASARSELAALDFLLRPGSPADLPRAFGMLRRIPEVPRGLFARLLWGKLGG